jgi:ATP synthase protein I
MPEHRPDKKQLRRLTRSSAVGLEMGISVVVGLLGGRWLDDKAGTAPWLMITGLLMGVFAGFRGLFRVAKEAQQRSRDAEREVEETKKNQPKP